MNTATQTSFVKKLGQSIYVAFNIFANGYFFEGFIFQLYTVVVGPGMSITSGDALCITIAFSFIIGYAKIIVKALKGTATEENETLLEKEEN